MAPAMNASATGIGWNRCALMALANSRPRIAAGRNATKRFMTNRRARASFGRSATTPKSFARYSQTMASSAPVWITISKTLPFSVLNESKSPARIRWPVDDTGRNSVSPSTTPMTSALSVRMSGTAAEGLYRD